MKSTFLQIFVLAVICLLPSHPLKADEGMWLLNDMDKATIQQMQKLGLQLDAKDLYNPKKASLNKAVVSFGGFCTGVIVSSDGLVFTNHHCGFDQIQKHSNTQHDYIRDGFFAPTFNDEIPNPGLFVSILLRTEKVTQQVNKAVKPYMDETTRQMAIDSICQVIQDRITKKDTTLTAIVSPYYNGNEYYLSVYKDYHDIRLVFAPPSSIGKFGGETDNWEWPRHNGDFSVFRIYANKNNQPAEYSTDNVPYKPEKVANISIDGYKEGDFCMTIGYPGETQRYLSSFGIEERMHTTNEAMIQVRAIKQKIWKEAMQQNDSIRIMYASKYDACVNYYKNSLGMNESIERLHVIAQKQALEKELMKWVNAKPSERQRYLHMLSELELAYKKRFEASRAFYYLAESFANQSSNILEIGLSLMTTDYEEKGKQQELVENIVELLKNCNLELDKKILIAMIDNYKTQVPDSVYQPEFYQIIATKYQGNTQAYCDSIYRQSKLTSLDRLISLLAERNEQAIFDDPIISVAVDVLTKLFEIQSSTEESTGIITKNERLLTQALREKEFETPLYSDANSTLRFSFGTVSKYKPKDGVEYQYYTTTRGIQEKSLEYASNSDFKITPQLLDMLQDAHRYGKFADPNGEMHTCFITNNDITGGNSGSPIFNCKGELVGLAFDGNWEAMSSDIVYNPELQRCIGVDIRYALYVMQQLSTNNRLLKEMKL